jgi:pimeloyl-ACP methyl ester carboxylesterase
MTDFISLFTSPDGEAILMKDYQAVLDRWPVAYKELRIPTSFGETYVIASGPKDAPPIVLLHAFFATATSWYRNVEALSQSYRVYAVDIIGEGNRSRARKPIKSMDDFLQWFKEVIDGLGVDTLYLVGNSYGGFTGAYYAMQLPERVRKLVLIGPAATIHSMPAFYLHMFIPKMIYILLPKLPGIGGVMRRSVDWMHKGLPYDPLWEPVFYHSMVYGLSINQVFPRVYSKEEFARLQAKVLLILGEQETIYRPEAAIRAAKELIPAVEIALIPNAHHVSALAQPELVNQRLLQFFTEERSVDLEKEKMPETAVSV